MLGDLLGKEVQPDDMVLIYSEAFNDQCWETCWARKFSLMIWC